ncbi:MAG: HD domain-containing protein [bacterium]|nr:HD domain-containing protein [bacterium]
MELKERLQKQLEFIKEIDRIKYIFRKTRLFNSDRHENDAEHSWHLCMIAMILAEHANEPIDILKVIKMLLIHDIVEIDAGDTFLFDKNKNHSNTEEELKAAKRIFGMLPEDQSEELISIWEEFEAFESKEARFARAMDHLEPILQNHSNQGGTWSEFEVPYETVVKKKEPIKQGSEFVWEHVLEILEESVNAGHLKKGEKV